MSRNLQMLQYTADILEVTGRLKEWCSKSWNADLDSFTKAIMRIGYYVNSMQLESHSFDTIISRMRSERNNALIRIQELEKKLDQYEPNIEMEKQFDDECDQIKKELEQNTQK